MKGDLFINDKDAYVNFGVSLLQGALNALLTPAPMKDFIESKSRLKHGSTVVDKTPRVDSREVTLQVSMKAANESDYATKYAAFISELQSGECKIRTRWQSGVVYRMHFQSCTQYSGLSTGRPLVKMTLKFYEPNPTNRAEA